jgi:membrane fusion protein, multidrug efflux system
MAEQSTQSSQSDETSEPNARNGSSGSRPPKSRSIVLPAVAGLIVVIFAATVLFIIFRPKTRVTTDDAYVRVHYATIAPRVSGQVSTVAVTDNQIVKHGQLLATLDDRDYRTAVDQAQAELDRGSANVRDVEASVERQPAEIEKARAALGAAQSRLNFEQANAQRYRNLAASGAGTTQQAQSSNTSLRDAQAQVRSAQAELTSAQRQLDGFRSQRAAAEGTVEFDRARLAQARLNLSYTRVVAPVGGMIGALGTQAGNYVTPGAALMSVVPLNDVYIEANYREVDLIHVERGQPVRIHVDAYDVDLNGTVDSVPPATGTTFAPVQPENATGNFTKIVQRLPVKIAVDPNQDAARLLRVGLSVETTIDTHSADVAADQHGHESPVTAAPQDATGRDRGEAASRVSGEAASAGPVSAR